MENLATSASSEPDPKPANALETRIQAKIAEIAAFANELPAVVLVHNNTSFSVEYMSDRGLQLLGISLEELKALGPGYHEKFFNMEEAKTYVPKIFSALERNDPQEWVSFFQQVKHVNKSDWTWYASGTKILMADDAGKPILSITLALPLDIKHHNTGIVERLQRENDFLRENFPKFSKLTGRERDILKLTCLGKSSHEIAETLFISPTTADTHRRNLKKKLDANTTYELSQYAMAFNLI